MTYGPVVVGIQGDHPSFYAATNYPYQCNFCPGNNTNINHAVLLVGYTPNFYIIKNSWGSGWGDQGYLYVSRTNDCGIKNLVLKFRSYTGSIPRYPPGVRLNITLTDLGNDGWGGYTFALRQNGLIRGTFSLGTGGSALVSAFILSTIMT